MPDPQIVYLDEHGNPQQNGASPVYLDEKGNPIGDTYKGPDTFWGGFRQSLGDTAMRTAENIPWGVAQSLDPRALAKTALQTSALMAFGSGAVPFVTPSPQESGDTLRNLTTPEGGGQQIGQLLTALAVGRMGGNSVPEASTGLPGRVLSAGWEGAKGAASRAPIVGPMARGFIRGARQGWAAGTPPATPAANAPMPAALPPDLVPVGGEGAFNAARPPALEPPNALNAAYQQILDNGGRFTPQAEKLPVPQPKVVPEGAGPQPVKPHLNPQQLAQYLRDQYGSEEASRMLYGRSQPGALARSEAQAAVKRLAPGESKLPEAAQRAIQQGIQEGSPTEAWDYIQAAPNDLARQYLISMMRGR